MTNTYTLDNYDDVDDSELTGGGNNIVDEDTTEPTLPGAQDNTITDEDAEPTLPSAQDTTTTISKVGYTEEDVKKSQFGSIYKRLTSDGKESQCAEFLAPQLMKQDRLFKHTYNATFGSFY